MTETGMCGRGGVYSDQPPDLATTPHEPRRQPKKSSAPASWGERPRYREPGDQPVGAAFNRRRNSGQARQAFT